MLLDVSPSPIGSLRSPAVQFREQCSLGLTTELILLNVELEIGTEAHNRKATITRVDGANEPVDGGIVLMGGCAAAGSPL